MLNGAEDVLDLKLDSRLAEYELLERRRFEAHRLAIAFLWKSTLPAGFPLILCFMGGTGTGKSTLFNSVVGRAISEVGTRRPFTFNAVILVNESWLETLKTCPFLSQDIADARIVVDSGTHPYNEIVIDTPDYDSIQLSNKRIAEDYFIIADLMVFVTSQEKYADLAGRRITEMAREWNKQTIFIMNKVVSETAYKDFTGMLAANGFTQVPLRVERVEPAPQFIPGLRERKGFAEVFAPPDLNQLELIRKQEIGRLKEQTVESIHAFQSSLEAHVRRVDSVTVQIRDMQKNVSEEMEAQLDALVTEDVQAKIQQRLQGLLRKYDVLFVPRMMVRNAILGVFGSLAKIFGDSYPEGAQSTEKDIRNEDLEQARSAVRLRPLESAIADLNFRIARLLSADRSLQDLRSAAQTGVPRLGTVEIGELYDKAFPGIEHLLEEEFNRFKDGLSRKDELKLYSSYTAWALFIITAEIVMGGGFTLLDALLNTVIVPFIPKWMVNLKVLDVLRDIGERVDRNHRAVLEGILEKQANLYVELFRGLIPDNETLRQLETLKEKIESHHVP
ncbi:GTPase [Desulfomonile tiedjei]|uniref:G domain-containing protein n=1 Tax=Desulfomonile tiedjei (strain ATCC 49306 / DSM 6799 / DCB-1) TaxID=706587 RepID=I4CCL3_DESTA|nr:GTPase [Desulfomonile tiedjei]AFM27304.1 hypothetical protein Desti_4683 [Desulfomonile tiedjei DSM 6799]